LEALRARAAARTRSGGCPPRSPLLVREKAWGQGSATPLAGAGGSPRAKRLPRLALTCLLLLLACAAPDAAPLTITAEPVAPPLTIPIDLPLRWLAGFRLGSPNPAFGGLSAMRLLDGGGRLVAISDRGAVVSLAIDYDNQGLPSGVRGHGIGPLKDPSGRVITGRSADAEGLAQLPDRRWVISFERRHRLLAYPVSLFDDLGAAVPTPFAGPPLDLNLAGNRGLETLAVLKDGRVLTIEEEDSSPSSDHRAWLRETQGRWQSLTYRSGPWYSPVDMALLGEDAVLVLERSFTLIGGFRTRVVRVPLAAFRPGATVEGTAVLDQRGIIPAANYEGIDTITGADGRTLVFLIADDNFYPLLPTVLLVFSLEGR